MFIPLDSSFGTSMEFILYSYGCQPPPFLESIAIHWIRSMTSMNSINPIMPRKKDGLNKLYRIYPIQLNQVVEVHSESTQDPHYSESKEYPSGYTVSLCYIK